MADANSTPSEAAGGDSSLKWIALGCGGCLGVTVLGIVALAFLISRTMRFGVGPNLEESDTQELFTYTLPGESQGIFTMGMFGLQVTQVSTTESPPAVLLTMGQLPRYIQGREAQESFVEQFQDSLATEGNYELTQSRVEERTLCGQPVSVLVQSGQFDEGGSTVNTASLLSVVEYDSAARFVWLLSHGENPEVTADQVFASLDCR
jgi:hypothetical protein